MISEANLTLGFTNALEYTRHDALGRPVWVRAGRWCDFVPAGVPEPQGFSVECSRAFVRPALGRDGRGPPRHLGRRRRHPPARPRRHDLCDRHVCQPTSETPHFSTFQIPHPPGYSAVSAVGAGRSSPARRFSFRR